MKLSISGLILLTLLPGTAAAAQIGSDQLLAVERPATAPRTIGQLIEQLRLSKTIAAQARTTHPAVISLEGSSDAFIIPVAGNTPGSGGTYYKSDLSLDNSSLQTQRIAVGWMAQGQNNCNSPVSYFDLPANSVTAAIDFVGTNLGKTGIGAILVLGVTTAGANDSTALIDGYSRIWTPQPGSTGTVSQNFTAISVTDSLGSIAATLMGLRQNSQFRTNVGIVNLDTMGTYSWTFTSVFTGVTTSLTVPPCSVLQVGASPGSGSTANGNVAFTVQSNGFGFYWSGFGSSTDNVTGDGWVARAIQ